MTGVQTCALPIYGTVTNDKRLTQDGYAAGHLQRFSIGEDGVIMGQYSNGQSQPLGQVVLANFANVNGLEPLGNNAWAESTDSGIPLVGVPDSGSFGVLQSSAVEDSNVDLTAELVAMITAPSTERSLRATVCADAGIARTAPPSANRAARDRTDMNILPCDGCLMSR